MKERKRFKLEIFALFMLTLASIVLVFAAFIWGWKYAPSYQSLPQTVQLASTPADIGELTTRVEALETIQNQNLKAFEWQLDQKLIILGSIAVFISFVAGFLGYKTYDGLDKTIDQEVRRALDQALYHLDPTNLRIWVASYDHPLLLKGDMVVDENGKPILDEKKSPQFETIETNVSVEMESVSNRVILAGLLNIEKIKRLGKECYDGVTIVPVFDYDMEKRFRLFLDSNKNKLDPTRAAFVLYTRDHRVQSKTLAMYGNLATANMPPTVASMILTVGRGLHNTYPSKKDETK